MKIGGFVPSFKNYKDIPPIKDCYFHLCLQLLQQSFSITLLRNKTQWTPLYFMQWTSNRVFTGWGEDFPRKPRPPKRKMFRIWILHICAQLFWRITIYIYESSELGRIGKKSAWQKSLLGYNWHENNKMMQHGEDRSGMHSSNENGRQSCPKLLSTQSMVCGSAA